MSIGSAGSRRTKVLMVNENIGGHETMHLHLKEALADHPRLEATFIDVAPLSGLSRAAARPVPGLARIDLDINSLREQLMASRSAAKAIRRQAARHDVIHVYTQSMAFAFPDLLREMPSVVGFDASHRQMMSRRSLRYPGVGTDISTRLGEHFERRVMHSATVLTPQSDWAAEGISHYQPAAPVHVIRHGIVVPQQLPRRNTVVPSITFVGRTLGRKGGLMLLDVWRKHFRQRSTLNLVTNEDVPSEPGMTVHRGLQPRDPRLLDLLSNSSIFAFPSDADMSPYVVLEAMAASLPVIAVNDAALPEMVTSGHTGMLIPPRDPNALKHALELLLLDHQRAQTMGRNGYELVRRRFNAHTTVSQLEDALVCAIERHNSDGMNRSNSLRKAS